MKHAAWRNTKLQDAAELLDTVPLVEVLALRAEISGTGVPPAESPWAVPAQEHQPGRPVDWWQPRRLPHYGLVAARPNRCPRRPAGSGLADDERPLAWSHRGPAGCRGHRSQRDQFHPSYGFTKSLRGNSGAGSPMVWPGFSPPHCVAVKLSGSAARPSCS